MSKFTKTSATYLFLLCFVAALSAVAQTPSDGNVKFFQGPNGTGAMQDIPPGTYKVDGKQLAATLAKDAVISVQVPRGTRVRFCEDQGTGGEVTAKCEEYAEGTHNLKTIYFTLIKVWKESLPTATIPPVIVYEQLNWGGRTQIFLPGMYRSDRGEFGKINDNMAMSTVIAKGFHVRFCEDVGINARGSGLCEEHDEGRHNLRFANSISFIEVIDLSDKSPADDTLPVVLYEDGSQVGKKQGFDVGVFLASLNQLGKVGNDKASSVSIKTGYRVLICPDEVVNEKCEEFGAGKRNLKQKHMASYVKVWAVDK